MNKLILTITLMFSVNAQASFFQNSCSNGEGTVQITSGHVSNKITLTEVVPGSPSPYKKVELDRSLINVVYSSKNEISTNTESSCEQPGNTSSSGGINWHTVSTKKVVITMKDGSAFSKNTLNRSTDSKSVEVHLICDDKGNAFVPCQ